MNQIYQLLLCCQTSKDMRLVGKRSVTDQQCDLSSRQHACVYSYLTEPLLCDWTSVLVTIRHEIKRVFLLSECQNRTRHSQFGHWWCFLVHTEVGAYNPPPLKQNKARPEFNWFNFSRHKCRHCFLFLQDEVLADGEKVVLKIEDLLQWIVHPDDASAWTTGTRAASVQFDVADQDQDKMLQMFAANNSGLQLEDIRKEKKLCGESSCSSLPI